MQTKVKLFGHPIHQQLVPIPLGLLVMAVVFDIIYMFGGPTDLTLASYFNIIAGVAVALLAALFGIIDYVSIPRDTRAKRIGTYHGLGNVVMVIFFVVAAVARGDNAGYAPTTGPFLLELLALGIGAVTGWLGGELVGRLGVGVDDGANVDAPSSLGRRRPRTETGPTMP